MRHAQVEEIPKQRREDQAGGGPHQSGDPEPGSHQSEHVRDVDGILIPAEHAAQKLDGGNGEGVAVGDDFLAEEVELEGGDGDGDAVDGGEALAHGLGLVVDAGLLVEVRDAVAHGEGAGLDNLHELSLGGGQAQGGGGEGVVELGERVPGVLDVLDGGLGGGDESLLGYLGGGLKHFRGRRSLLGLGFWGWGGGGWDGVRPRRIGC